MEKPELFGRTDQQESEQRLGGPPGFERCDREDWLLHPVRQVFWEQASGRLSWFDATTNEFRDLHEGSTQTCTFVGGASARFGSIAAIAAAARGVASGRDQAPKTVVITDLHRVAQALKMDLGHLDKPSALVAVFGASAGGGVPIDVAARVFHERLIKRLAAFRGVWSDDDLRMAAANTLEDLGAGSSGSHATPPAVAAVLTVGLRCVSAVTSGACYFCLSKVPDSSSGEGGHATNEIRSSAMWCLESGASAMPFAVALMTGQTKIQPDDIMSAASKYLSTGRPRAASVAILRLAAQRGMLSPAAAAFARLSPGGVPASPSQEPAAKRLKLDSLPSKVRIRQILLLHWKGVGPLPTDPIRRKQVNRPPEEAEARLLDVLDGLMADNCACFSGACKAFSECQSALKGGELVGDLGWLDRVADEQQAKSKPNTPGSAAPGAAAPGAALKSVVPVLVRKAAFELEIGELSDILTSELGAHILLRTA